METSARRWSELALAIGAGLALLVAAAIAGVFAAPEAWTLLAVLAGAYALSRGFAHSRWPDHDGAPQPAAPPASGRDRDAAAEVTVAEERLEVDKRQRPRERVQLRKEVVTEQVTITVPIRREVVRIERVPIRDGELPEALGELGTGRTQEIVLMEETAVVDKRIVPRERVWLEKDVETREERITETVRREEVEVDSVEHPNHEQEQR
jgi:uncharacterized protein (TIGR02271 family)